MFPSVYEIDTAENHANNRKDQEVRAGGRQNGVGGAHERGESGAKRYDPPRNLDT